MPPAYPTQLRPTLTGRAVLYAIARLVIAVALYPWFMDRLGQATDWLEWPASGFFSTQLISCLSALACMIVVVAGVERQPLAAVGFRSRIAFRDFPLGVLGGGIMLAAVIAFLYLAGWYQLDGSAPSSAHLTELTKLGLALLLAAAAEEILFRGLILRIAEDTFGSGIAVIGSAAYFSARHLENPSASLASFSGIVLAGLLLGMLYVATRSLWLTIGVHWAWNLFEGPVFGAPISGFKTSSLLRPTIAGPSLWTGGAFGPEAGLPLLLLAALVTLAALQAARRSGSIVLTPRFARKRHERPLDPPCPPH